MAYHIHEGEGNVYGFFEFSQPRRVEVYDYDDSKFKVEYSFDNGETWGDLWSGDSCVDFRSDAERLIIRAYERDDYQPEDDKEKLKGIWGIAHNEDSVYSEERVGNNGVCEYTITDFSCDHELHLADGWSVFNEEFRIGYDGGDEHRAGLWVNETLEEIDGIRGFTIQEELTFAFMQGEDFVTPWRVELNIPGEESVDLTNRISDGRLSYTPQSERGFYIEVYWTGYEFEYEAIARECDYEREYVVEIRNGEGGRADVLDEENEYRHGARCDRVRVLLPKTDRDITFIVTPEENCVFTEAWINGQKKTKLAGKTFWAKWVESKTDNTQIDVTNVQIIADTQEDREAAQTEIENIVSNSEGVKPAEKLKESVDTGKTVKRLNTGKGYGIEEARISEVMLWIAGRLDKISAHDGKIDSMEMTIVPRICIRQNGKEDITEEVSDSDLISDASVTFRIPIPELTSGAYAKVEHKFGNGTSQKFLAVIKGEDGNRYIEITVTEFSSFVITFTDGFYQVSDIPDQYYTGSRVCPEVTVKDGTDVFVEGVDYTVAYGPNTAVGKGTVTVTILASGIRIEKTFNIINRSSPVRPSGGSSAAGKANGLTYSRFWFQNAQGIWQIRNGQGKIITKAWLCDDAVSGNGKNVWYLINTDGTMVSAGLVQDNTGNFYSLETEHNGYFGSLRYKNGTYNCNGRQVYLEFEQNHNGSFGAVRNADGIAKLKAIYGVSQYGVSNSDCVYSGTFE